MKDLSVKMKRKQRQDEPIGYGSREMQQILLALERGTQTWDDLQKTTKLADDPLGRILLLLFDRRLIKTKHVNGERVYLRLPHPHS